MPEHDGAHLPCGAADDDLVAQVADRRASGDRSADARAHQARCAHCQAALAELEEVWAPVHALAGEPVRAPADVLAVVMARVRERPRHPWYAVVPDERGQTRIAARVVATVARLAAAEVPSVTLALGRGRTDVGAAGTHVVVDVQVAVALGSRIASVADDVRAHIARRVADYTGLTAQAVNVVVVDVTDRR